MTVAEALKWGTMLLGGGREARLEAEVLLGSAAGLRREALYARPEMDLSENCSNRFAAGVRERAGNGCPVAYLTGTKEFAGLTLAMRRGVFIPRPETEGLFELVADWWRAVPENSQAGVIVDPCSGSGALGISLAHHLKAKVVCIDIDPAASALTAHNAERLGLGGLVETRCGNFLDALDKNGVQVRAIAANPPYLAAHDLAILDREVADFEPRSALDGGADGLSAIRELAREGALKLSPGGLLALEIGADQESSVREILAGPDWQGAAIKRDLAGRSRYALAERGGN